MRVTVCGNIAIAANSFDLLRSLDSTAMVQGDPRNGHTTVIDGEVDLVLLVSLLEKEYSETQKRTGS
jgi:hypothetical protein